MRQKLMAEEFLRGIRGAKVVAADFLPESTFSLVQVHFDSGHLLNLVSGSAVCPTCQIPFLVPTYFGPDVIERPQEVSHEEVSKPKERPRKKYVPPPPSDEEESLVEDGVDGERSTS